MTRQDCVACGSNDSAPVLRSVPSASRPEVELRRCGACGLVFLSEYLDGFDARLYDYYASRLGRPKHEVFDQTTAMRLADFLAELAPLVQGRTLLDVGCGEGQFVDVALGLGWTARGIDLSRPAVQVAQGFGLPVAETDFFSEEIPRASVDLLTMFEFIEHVPSPGRFLERAEDVLRPGGVVHLTTPNFDSLDRRLSQGRWEPIHPEHLAYFTKATLSDLVRRCTNLELLSVRTRNFSPAILMSRLRGLLPQRSQVHTGEQPAKVAAIDGGARSALDANVRAMTESSRLLRVAKIAANRALDRFNSGSTMTMTLRRPQR